jgi:serine/threonine protein kinase/tetratricopeptide (TPR) repeat protein
VLDQTPVSQTRAPHGRVAHYRIVRKLGEGGMGVVYAAHDERLDRPVAIKMLRDGGQAVDRQRLWREARSAASVNHPNVCQLYEIGEDQGELFIAMELLEGESLAERLARGPMTVAEALQIGIAVLQPLESLHRRGFLHRDLKPSNVFLTPFGVKLLDFGLARPIALDPQSAPLTATGMVMGTPQYLAPEQLLGQEVGPRSDLFAVGVMLYEMLSGRQAFGGRSVMEIFDAVLHHDPPTLMGPLAVARADAVLRRALSKAPEPRYATASAMAEDLAAALGVAGERDAVTGVRSLRRLIVLPFRVLRPDPETDFLAYSLPDAVTGSLSNLESIVVRPSVTAARFADGPDLAEVAAKADVDVVLTGTLLRAGGHLRVATQLVEAREGRLVWSESSQVPLGDVFQLQDALTHRIVESLAVPLTAQDRQALRQDVPSDPRAYELYLRANHLATQAGERQAARALYRQCLELDPDFAPAWARLGRVERMIALYGAEQAEEHYRSAQEAFRRALALNPDLSMAQNLYALLEVDLGRARDGMVRLLGRAARRPRDPELLAGLVHTCRYCGLLDAALAAYERAVRLEPGVRTSVNHAYFMRRDYQRALETSLEDPPFVNALVLDRMGRRPEAVELLARLEAIENLPPVTRTMIRLARLGLEGRLDECRAGVEELYLQLAGLRDPCGLYYIGRLIALAGDAPRALETLGKAVAGGFACADFMASDPWLEGLHPKPEFQGLLHRARSLRDEARAAFLEAGGDRVLNVKEP